MSDFDDPGGDTGHIGTTFAGAREGPLIESAHAWPKWAIGNVPGIDIDAQDNVWILHRPRHPIHAYADDASYEVPISDCCIPAPAAIPSP